jgi:serine protease
MTRPSYVRLLCCTLLVPLVYGCDDNVPAVGPSAGFLEVTPAFAGVDSGATAQLDATLNGSPANVTWESSDPTLASVSNDGLVTALMPGRVSITATSGDEMRSASITVLSLLGIGISSGVPVTNVSSGSLEANEGLIYHITVPEGATSLTVTFSGGTGDGDVYVQKGSPSTDPDNFGAEDPGCHSWNVGNDESCTVTDPAAGTWYIFVAVFDPYAGATLTATVTP